MVDEPDTSDDPVQPDGGQRSTPPERLDGEPAAGEMPRWMQLRMGGGSQLAGLGVTFAASVALLTFAGIWLDRRVGTLPLFTLLGTFAGLVGGTISIIRAVDRSQRS